MKSFRGLFTDLFKSDSPPLINEESSLHEICIQYPHVYDFIERRYGVKVDVADKTVSLKEFVEKYGLPTAQILFMEVQLASRATQVREIPPLEAKTLLEDTRTRLLDVREEWEVKIGKIKNSHLLSPVLLDEILNQWDKDTPILIYCHHGIRSMDAAIFLSDRGFTKVGAIRGGIDAWSVQIDPSIPRYQGNYC